MTSKIISADAADAASTEKMSIFRATEEKSLKSQSGKSRDASTCIKANSRGFSKRKRKAWPNG